MLQRIFSVTLAILILAVSLGFCSEQLLVKNKERCNVILIVIDALRADHLGCYGYSRDTSPNIDKLAKQGVLFSRAFSHGPETKVSIPSMLTSLYPGIHSVFKLQEPLADRFITLPEILKENGYTSVLFGGFELRTFSNLDRRFDVYQLFDTPKNYGANKGQSQLINEKALAWLNGKHSKPFFLVIHYDYPHAPYDPPVPYDKIFMKEKNMDKETEEFLHSFNWYDDFIQFDRDREELKNPAKLNYLISLYDGEIKYADEQIKCLLEALNMLKLSENTLIILTADHGEEFFEHRVFFHGQLYDELIHVPLIMKLPGIIPQGVKVTNLVRHIDIMPTIFDILGIHSNNIMQGQSLLPLCNGVNTPEPVVFSESELAARHMKAIRTNKFKFIENYNMAKNSFSYELYDLKSDPKERNNLMKKNPERVNVFKSELINYTLFCGRIKKLILGNEFIKKLPTIKEQEDKKLKSLGYME